MTAPLLVIDASTYRGTAAIVDGGRVIAETETQMRGADEERLMPAVAALLAAAGLGLDGLGGIVCGEGPGSFTSLRIAASIAKGLVTATGQGLTTVSSLLLLAGGPTGGLPPGRYLALLDAIRGEWFGARMTVDSAGLARLEGNWELMDGPMAREIIGAESRGGVGPGQGIDVAPHARGLARISATDSVGTVDVQSWEPSYGRLPEAQAQWEQSHGRKLLA